MYTTQWKIDSNKTYYCYYECFASIRQDLSKIFKLRLVKIAVDKFVVIIRDYETDKLLDQRSSFSLDEAKVKSIQMAKALLIFKNDNECFYTKTDICPFEKVDGKKCSICELPDLFNKKPNKNKWQIISTCGAIYISQESNLTNALKEFYEDTGLTSSDIKSIEKIN